MPTNFPPPWSLDLLDPPFLAQELLPLGGPHAGVRQDCSWRRARPRSRGLEGPVPRTEVSNWDWDPNTTAALALLGLIVYTSLPGCPKMCVGKGGLGGRVSTSVFY